MQRVVLGLGSNRPHGNKSPLDILAFACAALSVPVKDLEFSSVYRTAAMYVPEQDDFLNMAVSGFYDGSPHELLGIVSGIEADFGRDRSVEFRNGPRPLDIDIEFFGKLSVSDSDLVIPHPRIRERAFVLVPVLDILQKFADVDKDMLEFLKKSLASLEGQRVEKALDSVEFKALVSGCS